ncbi:V-type ATPase subunit a family protein [Paenibacillus alvei]|uniref:V-type ATPase subunit a family protein n=1 Tax=Paenibacillus alvei TaxID=44250 RepID=A0ABT4EH90_PAEAL|nr:hypothetical protein [Paenibacillus alvei]MCY9532990.1 V-type ATPase subunit a family protein [Paenibacillus alvei]
MRKGIIVTTVVSLLLAGSVAGAAGSSLIGKKVAKEVQIEVDGKKTKSPAVIIDGVTYAPVREVGEMTGRAVKYEKGIVVMMSGGVGVGEEVGQLNPSIDSLNNEVKYRQEKIALNRDIIERQQRSNEESIKKYEENIMYKESNVKFTDTETYAYSKNKIETLTAENEKLEKEIAELERQKSELLAK